MMTMICLVLLAIFPAGLTAQHWWHGDTKCVGISTDEFKLPAPIAICISGYVGAGKSTLVQNLLGLSEEEIKVSHGFETGTVETSSWKKSFGGHELSVLDTPGFGDTSNQVDVVGEATKANKWAQANGHLKRLYFVADPKARGGLNFVEHVHSLAHIYGEAVARSIRIIINKADQVRADDRPRQYDQVRRQLQQAFGEKYEVPQGHILFMSAQQCLRPILQDILQACREPDLDLSHSRTVIAPPEGCSLHLSDKSGQRCLTPQRYINGSVLTDKVAALFLGDEKSGKSSLIEALADARIRERLLLIEVPSFNPGSVRELEDGIARVWSRCLNPKRIYYVLDGSSASEMRFGRWLPLLRVIFSNDVVDQFRFVVNKCDRIPGRNPDIQQHYAAIIQQQLHVPLNHILFASATQGFIQLTEDLEAACNAPYLNPRFEMPSDLNLQPYLHALHGVRNRWGLGVRAGTSFSTFQSLSHYLHQVKVLNFDVDQTREWLRQHAQSMFKKSSDEQIVSQVFGTASVLPFFGFIGGSIGISTGIASICHEAEANNALRDEESLRVATLACSDRIKRVLEYYNQ